MIKAVFFDLDGTLLPLNEDDFGKLYFSLLSQKMIPYGYDQKELISIIWQGTKLMYLNDGKKTNYDVFWEFFANHYGNEKLKDRPIFDSFYTNEFKQTKIACKDNPLAKKVKLADLKHNSDLSRLDLSVDNIPPKLELYKEAIRYLEE